LKRHYQETRDVLALPATSPIVFSDQLVATGNSTIPAAKKYPILAMLPASARLGRLVATLQEQIADVLNSPDDECLFYRSKKKTLTKSQVWLLLQGLVIINANRKRLSSLSQHTSTHEFVVRPFYGRRSAGIDSATESWI
jgi:hypothetical protein